MSYVSLGATLPRPSISTSLRTQLLPRLPVRKPSPTVATKDRCLASGRYWDDATGQCLETAPVAPVPVVDPTVPLPPPPVPSVPLPLAPLPTETLYDEGAETCASDEDCAVGYACQGGECLPFVQEPPSPGVPPQNGQAQPSAAPEEDNTALYVGLGLLAAAALAGGWFIIARKKKEKT